MQYNATIMATLLQGVVNDPKASDAIAKSVGIAKNRYLNTHTCEMSCAWSYVVSRTLTFRQCVCVPFLAEWAVDHSRVVLKVPDENGCDYINASYINVSTIVLKAICLYSKVPLEWDCPQSHLKFVLLLSSLWHAGLHAKECIHCLPRYVCARFTHTHACTHM